MDFLPILAQTIPVFLVMGVGFACQRMGLINDDLEKGIMRLVLNVLLPCFILWKVPGNPALQSSGVVVSALGWGMGITAISFAICFGAGKLIGLSKETGVATFAVAVGLQNYGFIPISLIEGIFMKDTALPMLGVLFVHNLGVEIVLWTLGVMLISGQHQGAWKNLISGPVIAILLGLTLNFSGGHEHIPWVVKEGIAKLGVCSIPISLMLVGASLGGVVAREGLELDWKIMSSSCLLRFGLLPLLFVAAALWVGPEGYLQRLLLIQAAMPSAVFPIVLAKFFGGKPRVAVIVALTTSVISLLVTPFLLTVLFGFFGIEIEQN